MTFPMARARLLSVTGLLAMAVASPAPAQPPSVHPADRAARRLAILAAEDRRGITAGDLATIRAGLRSGDAESVRLAVRASGRLERPDFVPSIVPLLAHPLPEIRLEAATAIAQCVTRPAQAARAMIEQSFTALTGRLRVESDPTVKSVLGESIGRLRYTTSEQVEAAEQALFELAGRSQSADDRLGAAAGLEALVRISSSVATPSSTTIDLLRTFVTSSGGRPGGASAAPDARVRRLALTALIGAGSLDDDVIRRAAADRDEQVRRLAMKAASSARVGPSVSDLLDAGLADPAVMVRIEALVALHARANRSVEHDGEPGLASDPDVRGRACGGAVHAAGEGEVHVALTAIDVLADCSSSAEAIAVLERFARETEGVESARGWHRGAHALVSLAAAAPDNAAPLVEGAVHSEIWHVRLYAARAAAKLADSSTLERLARDGNDNVREAAIEGLSAVAGHAADMIYLEALDRGGYQVQRAAALALAGTSLPEAASALKGALHRLVEENHDNSRDVRTAMADTLRGIGVSADPRTADSPTASGSELAGLDLPQLTATRARVVVSGAGVFEIALLAAEAPISAFRFARLVESGYYNGSTFHRVVPNFVVQGGSPAANEYVGSASFMRDEVGHWPHVRGAIGISTRGRDRGDAQFFVDLVDNPRLDHEYTVFAQVLTGMDAVDAILEGDVIEKIELLTGP
jgi:cyclophilin family peptidyl-prolyl cis-trans isomerase